MNDRKYAVLITEYYDKNTLCYIGGIYSSIDKAVEAITRDGGNEIKCNPGDQYIFTRIENEKSYRYYISSAIENNVLNDNVRVPKKSEQNMPGHYRSASVVSIRITVPEEFKDLINKSNQMRLFGYSATKSCIDKGCTVIDVKREYNTTVFEEAISKMLTTFISMYDLDSSIRSEFWSLREKIKLNDITLEPRNEYGWFRCDNQASKFSHIKIEVFVREADYEWRENQVSYF